MTILTYGDHSIDTAQLPESSLVALMNEGLTHYLGNRVASRVSGWCEAQAGENATKELVKVWKDSHEAEVSAQAATFRQETIDKLLAGTIGVRAARGPSASADPMVAEMRKLAKEELVAMLAKAGMKFPKKDEALIFANGTKLTGDEMIARRLDAERQGNNREAIERQAKRNLDARRKAADAVDVSALDSLAA